MFPALARLRLRALARPLKPALAARLLVAVERIADAAELARYAARVIDGDTLDVTIELLARNPPEIPTDPDDVGAPFGDWIRGPTLTSRPTPTRPGEIRAGFAEIERAARGDQCATSPPHASASRDAEHPSTPAPPAPPFAARPRTVGMLDARHYATYPPDVTAMKRAGDWDGAAALLTRLIDVVEAEADAWRAEQPQSRARLAPWYYLQLAIICRKQGRYADEVAVCDRFLTHSAGGTHADVVARRAAAMKRLRPRAEM